MPMPEMWWQPWLGLNRSGPAQSYWPRTAKGRGCLCPADSTHQLARSMCVLQPGSEAQAEMLSHNPETE